MHRVSASASMVSVVLLALLPCAALAQGWPTKPVRVIVPSTAGGAVDQVVRLVGEKLAVSLGQPVIVDNRPGANGVAGTEFVARSAPDGYTLIAANSSTHESNVVLMKSVPYDAVRDFTPIVCAVDSVSVLAVHPALPANSVRALIDVARQSPGRLSYASAGSGSAYHLAGEVLKHQTGIDMVHVPYKGLAPAMGDLVAGQVQVAVTALSIALPQAKAGKVRVLAIVGEHRFDGAPDLPPITEAVPGYRKPATWVGFVGPAGMAGPLVERLNAEIVRALNAPDVKSRLDATGLVVVGGSPAEYGERIRRDIADYREFARVAGVRAE